MSTVEEIEQAIEKLTPEEHKRLRDWMYEQYWAKWDKEFEEDVASGRLDKLAEEALADFEAGRCREL